MTILQRYIHCSAGLESEVLCCGLCFNSVLYVRLNCKLNLSKRICSERAIKMNKLLSLTFIHLLYLQISVFLLFLFLVQKWQTFREKNLCRFKWIMNNQGKLYYWLKKNTVKVRCIKTMYLCKSMALIITELISSCVLLRVIIPDFCLVYKHDLNQSSSLWVNICSMHGNKKQMIF